MNFLEQAISRASTVVATMVLISLTGIVAFLDIPKEANPDINVPVIYIVVTHTGISPTDAERLLVRPMETELHAVEGLKEIRATAFEGGANILLEFEAGFDASKAIADVRAKVNHVKLELPQDTDEPSVHEVNFSLFPVVTVALSGDVPERTLLTLARSLEQAIERLPSVLSVDIGGNRDQQIEVVIDPVLVESYGLSTQEFSQFLTRSNKLIAAGTLDMGKGRFAVKVPGLLETVEDIMELPLRVSGDAVIRIKDIASVRKTFKDAEGLARIGGKPAVTLEVSKRIGENILDTVESVRTAVTKEQNTWPTTAVHVDIFQDQSEHVRERLHDLQNSLITAVTLVMIVVVGTLGIRSGLIVSLAIPGSFLLAILFIFIIGLTINIVVLFGLILSVGILVDGAIIVTEYADRRMTEGLSCRDAYVLSSRRMAWPVLSSTATTVAAFLPLLFWNGIVGEFMKYLPVTLTATLVASLIMALVFVPVIGTLVGRPIFNHQTKDLNLLTSGKVKHLQTLKGFTGWYARCLDQALYRPAQVIGIAIFLLVSVQGWYWVFGRGVEFFPDVEPDNAILYVHAQGNLATAEKDQLVKEVEERILAMDQSEFRVVYTLSGRKSGFSMDITEDVIGRISLEFTDWQQRRKADVILDDVRRRTADLPGIALEVRKQQHGPPVGKPVQIQLTAPISDVLPAAVTIVRHGMESVGDFIDIEDTQPMPGIEWRLVVDRSQAVKYGIDVTAVGDMVNMVTRGLKLTDYRPEDSDKAVDVVIRFPERSRTIPQLDVLRVSTPSGIVPLTLFVEKHAEPRTGSLHRTDSQRVVTIQANVTSGTLVDDKVKALKAWLQKENIDEQIRINFKGEDEEQNKSRNFLLKAFGSALLLISVILLAEFDSFYSVLLILSSVVFSTIGVILGLLILDQPFGVIMSGIGTIALAGVVVNNNIVLLDTYKHLQSVYSNPHDAALHTGIQRLRPVLLTAVTTVLGLLPTVFGVNVDLLGRTVTFGAPSMQWWVQLSTAMVFGLSFATVLTLIVTPSALMLRAKAKY